MNTFGDRLVALRENLDKISQTDFATSLGTSRGVIVNLEKGKTEPKPQFLSLRKGGTLSSTEAVQITRVRPHSIRTEPAAVSVNSVMMLTGRS